MRSWVRTVHLLAAIVIAFASGPALAVDAQPPGFCFNGSLLNAEDLPPTIDTRVCPLEGRFVSDHGIAAAVPPPGLAVFVEAYGAATQVLRMEHLADRTLKIFDAGSEQRPVHSGPAASTSAAGPVSPPECYDDAYSYMIWAEHDNHTWFINPDSTSGDVTQIEAQSALIAGYDNIKYVRNDCSPIQTFGNGTYGVNHTFGGTTTLTPNMTADSCTARDGINVVGWGFVASNWVAFMCGWYYPVTWELAEADVKFGNNNRWTTSPDDLGCFGQYDIQSVMTHEAGHVFGMDHVDELTHGRMTMSTNIDGPCQSQERMLGRGDVFGLMSLYR